jgi:pSer/pThr/pTyr-binding forkhead associated (FHA) protein
VAKLLIHESTGIREFELVDEEVHIGRELDNTLRLPDPSVSRHHAVLKRTPEGYMIQDKNSSNGLYVNDEKIAEAALSDGDQFALGQLLLTFQDPENV